MRLDLCRPCMEAKKKTHKLSRVAGGKDNKITCAGCGRRRFGYTYEARRKERRDQTCTAEQK